ncbi:hypothetical protein [Nocardioides campestrisoli]|uniref:hypothetical protein n=1 Tax=Nocardioides campestrisoli TaxID=2736757 RepID=UPI0015E6305A|nr:hypothetical protein [Nocardioides campestrisoli]
MASDYRFSPALTARMLGVALIASAVLIALATVGVAVLSLHTMVLLVPVLLVLVALVTLMAWSNGWVVRLRDEGYEVRRVRGAGVSGARWRDVEDVVTTHRHGSPCVVIRLRDGRTTTIPADVLNADKDAFARDVVEHLQRGHGVGAPGGS